MLAASHFHIHFSRIGLNNVWDGLFVAFISGAFWWGWTRNSRLGYVLAGLGFGLAQYFYASSRLLFLLFPIWLAVSATRDWPGVRARLNHLVIMALSALVITLPLAMVYMGNIPDFYAPMSRVSYLGDTLRSDVLTTGKTPVELLASQFITSALAFTSENLRHWYVPETPMLLPLSATLFLMGVVLLFLKFRKPAELWLILWLAGAVVIGALSESTPAAQRYVFAAPAVAATIGLALVRISQWLIESWPLSRPGVVTIVGILVALACWADLSFYFGDYSAEKRFGDLNTETAIAVAQMLGEREPGVRSTSSGAAWGTIAIRRSPTSRPMQMVTTYCSRLPHHQIGSSRAPQFSSFSQNDRRRWRWLKSGIQAETHSGSLAGTRSSIWRTKSPPAESQTSIRSTKSPPADSQTPSQQL